MTPASRTAVLLAVACALLLAAPAPGQSGGFFNQRDDEYTLLGLKRAREAYELAKSALARSERLHADAMVADAAVEEARGRFAEAEVNYQQSILAALFENQYVAVTGALKVRDGRRQRVRLRLENTSGGGAELAHLADLDDPLFAAMKPDVIHDVYVSLANDEGAVVSRPYERKLEQLHHGRPAVLDLELLRDLDAVTVLLTWGRGSQRSMKVLLEKDASADRVVVESRQFSQEVELGASGTFDLTLELFSGQTEPFRLMVAGLPPEITYAFRDPASGARLSQFRFGESSQTQGAALEVFLPDRAGERVVAGRSIPFWVLVAPQDRDAAAGELVAAARERPLEATEMAAAGIGAVRLELVPRGVGRLRVRAPQLYAAIDRGAVAEATLELINEGSRRLDNVEVTVEPPLGWQATREPALVPTLGVGEEAAVTLRFTPPADVAVGKYEIRVRATSFADNQPIEGDDKTFTVEVRPQVRLAPTLVLVVLLLAAVGGVVVAGVRLSRR